MCSSLRELIPIDRGDPTRGFSPVYARSNLLIGELERATGTSNHNVAIGDGQAELQLGAATKPLFSRAKSLG
jgi:hypothetical protein